MRQMFCRFSGLQTLALTILEDANFEGPQPYQGQCGNSTQLVRKWLCLGVAVWPCGAVAARAAAAVAVVVVVAVAVAVAGHSQAQEGRAHRGEYCPMSRALWAQ